MKINNIIVHIHPTPCGHSAAWRPSYLFPGPRENDRFVFSIYLFFGFMFFSSFVEFFNPDATNKIVHVPRKCCNTSPEYGGESIWRREPDKILAPMLPIASFRGIICWASWFLVSKLKRLISGRWNRQEFVRRSRGLRIGAVQWGTKSRTQQMNSFFHLGHPAGYT